MPKRRTTKTPVRDLTYEEAFGALPTALLELVYAAKDAAGLDYERVPSPTQWEAMGKQGRLRYLARRERELPKLLREQQARNAELKTELRDAPPATTDHDHHPWRL